MAESETEQPKTSSQATIPKDTRPQNVSRSLVAMTRRIESKTERPRSSSRAPIPKETPPENVSFSCIGMTEGAPILIDARPEIVSGRMVAMPRRIGASILKETRRENDSFSCSGMTTGNRRTYKTETRIVLMGETGSGKSSTGNTLLGKRGLFTAKLGKKSVTQTCSYDKASFPDRNILVVDTPGFFDTGMEKVDIKKEIAKCYGLVCPGPHAVLLTIPVDTRRSNEARIAFDHILEIFGEDIKRYVLLVFTKADQLEHNLATENSFLKEKDSNLASILEQCGDRCVFIDNTVRLERDINKQRMKILSKIDVMVGSNLHFEDKLLKKIEILINAIPQETGVDSSDVLVDPSPYCGPNTDTRPLISNEKSGLLDRIIAALRELWERLFDK